MLLMQILQKNATKAIKVAKIKIAKKMKYYKSKQCFICKYCQIIVQKQSMLLILKFKKKYYTSNKYKCC